MIDEAPDSHLCERCDIASYSERVEAENNVDNLCRSLRRLEIQDQESNRRALERVEKRQTMLFENDGHDIKDMKEHTFGLATSEEKVLWVQEEEEASYASELIAQLVRNVANIIAPQEFIIDVILSEAHTEFEELRKLLRFCSSAESNNMYQPPLYRSNMPSIRSVDILKGLMAAAVRDWVFYPSCPEVQTTKIVLFDIYQEEILSKSQMNSAAHRSRIR